METITVNQIQHVYELSGRDAELCKSILKTFGYASSTEIKTSEYALFCAEMQNAVDERAGKQE